MKNRIIAIYRRIKPHRHGEGLSRSNSGREGLHLDEEQLASLKAAVEICPEASLEELRKIVSDDSGSRVSLISVSRALNALNLSPVKRSGKVYNFSSAAREEKSQ